MNPTNPDSYRYTETLPPGSATLEELLKSAEMQELFAAFYALIGVPLAIIDRQGNVLVSSPWQRICVQYHRATPATCERCVASDVNLAKILEDGEPYAVTRCPMGLTDCAAPIYVDDEYVANVFIGQFLTEPPDEAAFLGQARTNGFDAGDYIAAVRELPILDAATVPRILTLLTRMTRVVTKLSVELRHIATEKARHALILDTIPQSVFWKDREGHYLGCNRAFADTIGLAPADVIGRTDSELGLPPGDTERYRADDLEVIATATPRLNIREAVQATDGRTLTVDTAKFPLVHPDGTPYAVLGIYTDITDRVRAEAQLRESEEKFRAAFMTGSDAFVIIGRLDGRIMEANDRFLEMYGFTREECIGRTSIELGCWGRTDQRLDVLAELQRSGFARDIPIDAVRKSGQHFPVLYSVTPLDLAGQKPLYVGVIRDVSAQKALEAQLAQAQKMEAIGQLAGGVAHDFNNLLFVITTRAELALRKLQGSDPLREQIELIQRTAERAAGLTRQLLAFSRKQVLQPKVLALNSALTDVEKMLRRLLPEHIVFTLALEPGAGNVLADPGQLEQVVMNLVVNARDAMPEGGRLEIATSRATVDGPTASAPTISAGSYVELRVRDTGCGMSDEVQAHIFEPFFTTKPAGQGTGLGLPTCYGIVTQSGGHIRVASSPGGGTTFTVMLPRVEAPAAVATAVTTAARAPTSGTILLVEDEDQVRAATAQLLTDDGFCVLAAKNGREGLAILERRQKDIDVVLTDIVMPEMGGVQLGDCAAALGKPVLYMSGYTDVDPAHLSKVGVHCIQKPSTPRALREKLHDILANRPTSS